MTKIQYSAKLSNGHIVSRTSVRTYTHFWRVSGRAASNEFSGHAAGFSASLVLAKKQASAAIARFRQRAGADLQIETEIVEAHGEPGSDLVSQSQKPGFVLAA